MEMIIGALIITNLLTLALVLLQEHQLAHSWKRFRALWEHMEAKEEASKQN